MTSKDNINDVTVNLELLLDSWNKQSPFGPNIQIPAPSYIIITLSMLIGMEMTHSFVNPSPLFSASSCNQNLENDEYSTI